MQWLFFNHFWIFRASGYLLWFEQFFFFLIFCLAIYQLFYDLKNNTLTSVVALYDKCYGNEDINVESKRGYREGSQLSCMSIYSAMGIWQATLHLEKLLGYLTFVWLLRKLWVWRKWGGGFCIGSFHYPWLTSCTKLIHNGLISGTK